MALPEEVQPSKLMEREREKENIEEKEPTMEYFLAKKALFQTASPLSFYPVVAIIWWVSSRSMDAQGGVY